MNLTETLLEKCRPLLRLQVRRLHLDKRLQRRFDSSDLVQETYTRAIVSAEQFRGVSEGELICWLQRILQRVVLNKVEEAGAQVRDFAREYSIQDAMADSSARIESFIVAQTPSPVERVERAELLLKLSEAIERLPEEQRDVVNLRDVHGYTIAQIASSLEKTEKSIAGLLLRGRLTLRQVAREIGLSPL